MLQTLNTKLVCYKHWIQNWYVTNTEYLTGILQTIPNWYVTNTKYLTDMLQTLNTKMVCFNTKYS